MRARPIRVAPSPCFLLTVVVREEKNKKNKDWSHQSQRDHRDPPSDLRARALLLSTTPSGDGSKGEDHFASFALTISGILTLKLSHLFLCIALKMVTLQWWTCKDVSVSVLCSSQKTYLATFLCETRITCHQTRRDHWKINQGVLVSYLQRTWKKLKTMLNFSLSV